MTTAKDGRSKRRLGRGLSSLIGEPVRIHQPQEQGQPSQPPAGAGGDRGAGSASPPGSPATASPVTTEGGAGQTHQAESVGEERRAGEARPAQKAGDTGTPAEAGERGEAAEAGEWRRIRIDRIRPNPFQPRKEIDPERLAALAASIRAAGVMQPLLVRPGEAPGRFELIAGERRWRAARLAGLDEVPAVVHDLSDAEAAEWAVVENLQREDLDPIERAEAFQSLIDRFGLTQSQVAERVGIDRSSVANFLRLNQLEAELKDDVRRGRLSAGHAKALLAIHDSESRRRLAREAIEAQWSVRETERRADLTINLSNNAERGGGVGESGASPRNSSSSASSTPASSSTKPAHVLDLERRIGAALGLPARINLGRNKTSGHIVLHFATLDEFDSLLEQLGAAERA